jgi:hypothetical protein
MGPIDTSAQAPLAAGGGWRFPGSVMQKRVFWLEYLFCEDFTMTEHHLTHSEILANGRRIEVRAKILRDGSLQMFIGVYQSDGTAMLEDHHPSPHYLDMEAALDWGIDIARSVANDSKPH